jgi:hypothetical protein
MSQTLTPWGSIGHAVAGGFTFSVEATVDGAPLHRDDGAGGALRVADDQPAWKVLVLRFDAALDGDALAAEDILDLELVVGLRCARTEIRRRLEIEKVPIASGEAWRGSIELDRDELFGAVDLEASMVGTVGGVRWAKLASRSERVVVDEIDLDIPSRGEIDIRWRDFENAEVAPGVLHNSAGLPSALLIEGDQPVLYLNAGLGAGAFKIVLSKKRPSSTVQAARTMFNLGLAIQTRRELLDRAFLELVEDDQRIEGPTQRWAELLLAETARAMDDWSRDEFYKQAYDLHHRDPDGGAPTLSDWAEFNRKVDAAVMRSTHAGEKLGKASERLRDG